MNPYGYDSAAQGAFYGQPRPQGFYPPGAFQPYAQQHPMAAHPHAYYAPGYAQAPHPHPHAYHPHFAAAPMMPHPHAVRVAAMPPPPPEPTIVVEPLLTPPPPSVADPLDAPPLPEPQDKRAAQQETTGQSGSDEPGKEPHPSFHTRSICLRGMPHSATEKDMAKPFEKFEGFKSCIVVRDAVSNASRGFGFVAFETSHHREKAFYGVPTPLLILGAEVEVRRAYRDVSTNKNKQNNGGQSSRQSSSGGRFGPSFPGPVDSRLHSDHNSEGGSRSDRTSNLREESASDAKEDGNVNASKLFGVYIGNIPDKIETSALRLLIEAQAKRRCALFVRKTSCAFANFQTRTQALQCCKAVKGMVLGNLQLRTRVQYRQTEDNSGSPLARKVCHLSGVGISPREMFNMLKAQRAVLVQGMPQGTDRDDVAAAFAQFGAVAEVRLHGSRGVRGECAFLVFAKREVMFKVLASDAVHLVRGKPVSVRPAKTLHRTAYTAFHAGLVDSEGNPTDKFTKLVERAEREVNEDDALAERMERLADQRQAAAVAAAANSAQVDADAMSDASALDFSILDIDEAQADAAKKAASGAHSYPRQDTSVQKGEVDEKPQQKPKKEVRAPVLEPEVAHEPRFGAEDEDNKEEKDEQESQGENRGEGSGKGAQQDASLPKHLSWWDQRDVQVWLERENMQDFGPMFAQHEMTGLDLLELDDDVLKKEFKMRSFGKRRKLLRAVKVLQDKQ